MLTLREIQNETARTLLSSDDGVPAALRDVIADGDGHAAERLAVYRNNVMASLTEVLRETFPVVGRLVGEGFFAYAAHEFIVANPPSRPALFEYGGAFPDFLGTFPPCRELVYLADVARLEWMMNTAATAPDEARLSPAALRDITPERTGRLGFRLHPAHGYLESPWPIDRIWLANRADGADEIINLDTGAVRLEIGRRNDTVSFRTLGDADFAFRCALANGAVLESALELALSINKDFAAGNAMAALFQEGAVVALNHHCEQEQTP